jgi:hypothetical protein
MTTSSRALALLAALVGLSGCTSFELSRLGHDLARDIERSTDATVEPGYAVALGRGQIGTARFLARAASPAETAEARRLLGHVRYAAFGRYPLVGRLDGRTLPAPRALDRYRGDGWFPFVTVRDSASAVWVLLRERDDGALTDLVTVAVSENDVVLTKVSGDLGRLVLDAIAMGGDGGLFGGALDEARIVVRDGSEPGASEDGRPTDPER